MSAPDFNHDRALAYPMRPALPDHKVIFDLVFALVPSSQERPCFICGAEIPAGQIARVRFEIKQGTERQAKTFRACTLCCLAMSKADIDNGRAFEARRAQNLRRA